MSSTSTSRLDDLAVSSAQGATTTSLPVSHGAGTGDRDSDEGENKDGGGDGDGDGDGFDDEGEGEGEGENTNIRVSGSGTGGGGEERTTTVDVVEGSSPTSAGSNLPDASTPGSASSQTDSRRGLNLFRRKGRLNVMRHHSVRGLKLEKERQLMEVERRVAFTDAAAAIALTLLILPLMEATVAQANTTTEQETNSSSAGVENSNETGSVNDGNFTQTNDVTVKQWYSDHLDSLGAYALSFFVIVSFWRAHDELFCKVGRATGLLSFLSFSWLFLITFVPVSTALVTKSSNHDDIRLQLQYLVLFVFISLVELAMLLEVILHKDTWHVEVYEHLHQNSRSDEEDNPNEQSNNKTRIPRVFITLLVGRCVTTGLLVVATILTEFGGIWSILILLLNDFFTKLVLRWRPDWDDGYSYDEPVLFVIASSLKSCLQRFT